LDEVKTGDLTMSLGRSVKRTVMGLVVISAGGFAAMHPGAVKAFYQDIYPRDPAMREALDRCFLENHDFNRLVSGARDACYRHILLSAGDVSSAAPQQRDANLIDLTRAAGQGSVPRNDIRRLEQTEDARHTAH
jgi:hypothetical protein